jgi:hypothetical protein
MKLVSDRAALIRRASVPRSDFASWWRRGLLRLSQRFEARLVLAFLAALRWCGRIQL